MHAWQFQAHAPQDKKTPSDMTRLLQNDGHDREIDARVCFGNEGHGFFQSCPEELMPRCGSQERFHLAWSVRAQRYLKYD